MQFTTILAATLFAISTSAATLATRAPIEARTVGFSHSKRAFELTAEIAAMEKRGQSAASSGGLELFLPASSWHLPRGFIASCKPRSLWKPNRDQESRRDCKATNGSCEDGISLGGELLQTGANASECGRLETSGSRGRLTPRSRLSNNGGDGTPSASDEVARHKQREYCINSAV
ncbi:hypothetical protein BM1_03331 [Bipolaris maydis]|nr:hypothetical protein BM1_03331 [Bipolaris maydis]